MFLSALQSAADIQREITCRLSGDVDDFAALRTQLITLVDVLNRV